jgi:type IV pilus assembly protein PilQ
MKTNGRAQRVAITLMAVLAVWASTVAAVPSTGPTVQVQAVVEAGTVRFEASGSGPFEYTTYRPTERLFVVDVTGVAPGTSSGARVLDSELVSSYRVLQYRSGERAIVRLEILLRAAAEPKVERAGNILQVTFSGAVASANKPGAPISVSAPARAKALPAATLIHAVAVGREGSQTSVEIKGNGRLSYETLRLENPDRLVLDFAGTRVRPDTQEVKEGDPVRSVRLGQFKADVGRVVIDLARGVPYSVSADGASVRVTFGAAFAEEKTEAMPATSTPAPKAPVVEPMRPRQVERPVRAAVEPVPAVPQSMVPAAAEMILPANLTGSGAMHASPAPPAARVEVPVPVTSTASLAPAPAKANAAAAGQYSGEPISVNFKDVDLKDFFRLIHEISGLNVVVDPTVRGTVTIVLDDVPWDQALDIVLRNNALDKQVEGNVLRIATKATLKKEAEENRDLAKAEAEAIPQETRTRTLSYAKASAMRATLQRFLSPRGEILADERSNTLVIRDIPTVFPALNTLMDQLDRKSQQVEIEARVVSATRSFARDIGTQFGFATSAAGGRTVFGGLVGNNNFVSPIERGPGLPAPPLVASGTSSIPLNTNLGVGQATSGASFAHASPNLALDFIISAAESKGVGKLLSRPKVITQNNEKAVVKQGTKVPIQTVINNTISVTFIDAVLKLEVTPQITAEGTIFMEVVVENTAIDEGIPRVQGIPALTTQSTETKVLIEDGGTVVLGGIMISSQRTDIAQVPLLGSIPLIGHLFKRTSVSSTSQELLFFVTPRIVSN